MRQAKAYAAWCRIQRIVLDADELLAGTPPHLCFGTDIPPLDGFGHQQWQPWFPMDAETTAYFTHGLLCYAGNHTTIDYQLLLTEGLSGVIARIDERLSRVRSDEADAAAQTDFLRALRVVAEGYIDLCRRYGALAEAQAAACTDAVRAEELQQIAVHCRRVVAEPARNFREACQSLWFGFLFQPDAPGRVDYLLWPFFQGDLAQGALTREAAKELLGELWIKYFSYLGASQPVGAMHHLTLGGVTPDGADASSALTDLCLEVTHDLQLHRPQVGLRWHADMPAERLRAAVRTWRSGTGSPDLCNDMVLVPALTAVGVAVEDARDFSLSGCQEVIVSGKAQMGSVEGFINVAKTVRMALGLEPELFTPPQPAPETFDAFWEVVADAMARVVAGAHTASHLRDEAAAADPALCASLLVHDCIERAKGYSQGGARYNFCNWNAVGMANTADALLAIKRLVYDERQLTLAELRAALQADWQGYEALQQRMLQAIPKFGNDEDEVDALAARIITHLDACLKRHTPYRGGSYILGTLAGAENMHMEFGRVTGATPDGRRQGERLADSIGAAQGRDRQGITALLNSVAKLPHGVLPTATTLNLKLDPGLIATEEGVALVADLIRAHFRAGGQHCQVNLATREQLLAARAHPELHQNLMVRVAGYSAPFVALYTELQDEIIARTAHAD